jgi:tRNA1Val (adenine37-N6)-methyltransferase
MKMSKNSIYTYNYFQPKEYRFSLDSVFLAQKIAANYFNHPQKSELKILDLCAGCGIIGLELALHLQTLPSIDFLEIQLIYLEYFNKNVEMIFPNAPKDCLTFLPYNYDVLQSRQDLKARYDLIVCNPPYFFLGEGLLSPSEFKNRCRFFIDSNFENLIRGCLTALKNDGKAFLLLRPGDHHGRNAIEMINEIVGLAAQCEVFDNVRGTDVVCITKKKF